MKKWQVWSEGFKDMGGQQPAAFHGEFEAETFKGAVKAFRNSLTDEYSIKCIDIDRLTFWGCRFYDNECDARKNFG